MCSRVMWQAAPESLDPAIGNLWLRSQYPGQRTKARPRSGPWRAPALKEEEREAEA